MLFQKIPILQIQIFSQFIQLRNGTVEQGKRAVLQTVILYPFAICSQQCGQLLSGIVLVRYAQLQQISREVNTDFRLDGRSNGKTLESTAGINFHLPV